MLIWLDLETTGLLPQEGSILEIAIVITDDELNEVGEPFVSIVKPLEGRGFEVMDDFVYEMHTKSGLLTRLYEGHHGDTDAGWGRVTPSAMARDLPLLSDVEHAVLHSLRANGITEGNQILAGSSIHFDRAWINEHMPLYAKCLSHRMVDVSTLTLLAKAWAPEIYGKRPGLGPDGKPVPQHRALDDIRMSIETLRYYRKAGFVGGAAK
jgi:oligoribonuclease